MDTNKIYDIVGIGIGPFNLGMAALTEEILELDCIFIDKNDSFNWHPGLMLETAKMQVPFFADLVTLADPCSRFTYLNFLKSVGRLFKFAVSESYYPYRSEYNNYCQWVVKQLGSLQFGFHCDEIHYDELKKIYSVILTEIKTGIAQQLHGKHIVMGIGTAVKIPDCTTQIDHPLVFHSGQYLQTKHAVLMNKHITIIGSGQSAAEIFLDVLPHINNLKSLHWITRSKRFYPMDYSKLALEMSLPDYIHYFFDLDPDKKHKILKEQQYLYRGINSDLIQSIYEQLYLLDLDKENNLPDIRTSCDLKGVKIMGNKEILLEMEHLETGKQFEQTTDALILATGYKYQIPAFLEEVKNIIQWTVQGNYDVQRNYSIDRRSTLFVQNAEQHTHGFNSADLGLGPYRNAVILNSILKYEYYSFEKKVAFQDFGHSFPFDAEA